MPTDPARRPSVTAAKRPSLIAAISVGGALGGMARYGAGVAFPTSAGSFPWTTLWINVLGSLLLGVLVVLALAKWPTTVYARPFLGVGFLGAFTTFSTFAADIDRRLASGHGAAAVSYAALSVLLGLLAAFAGMTVGRALRDRGAG